MSTPEKTPAGGLLRFFGHPSVGVAGSVASIIGLVLAVYFYRAAQSSAELTAYVNPARAVVVRSGDVSTLSVSHNGRRIGSDISAAQVAIWNEGRSPIRRGDILQPITISAEAPVLEATVRKRSRPLTQFAIANMQLSSGKVTVTWEILERNDGAVVQLIYAGSPDAPIRVDGAVVGQPAVSTLKDRQLAASERRPDARRGLIPVIGWTAFVLGLLSAAMSVWRLSQGSGRLIPTRVVVYIGVPLLYLLLGVYILAFMTVSGPPFGF